MVLNNSLLINPPRVSVIVPSYNHGLFLTTCIKSILNQDYPNFDLVVIDDGSTDNSREILTDLQKEFDFNVVFQRNQGVSYTLNRGLKEFVTGEYFTFCASDDYWLPGKLSKQIMYLEENESIPMVFGKAKIVDMQGNFISEQTNLLNSNLIGGWIFEDIFFQNFHPPINYMFRTKTVIELGYYDEQAFAEDFDMNLRVSFKYPIGYIDEFISCYRVGLNSTSYKDPTKIIDSHLYSINKFKNTSLYKKALLKWNYRAFLWQSSYKKLKIRAFKSMLSSVSYFFKKPYIKSIKILILNWN